ncbi:oxygenase MpaB family protein [Arthrobacter sp. KK5.5]|uniref:oxygenase MpaB family protein n=1 Tax=Arthrobacter sp. KK5.5 TaxID=3373084 RepID=UPI003EE6E90E
MDVLAPLRTRLQLTFAGQTDGIPAWETALAEGDDAGHFPPDSAVWAVHGGMTPIAAGIRALLVQALHPGALAGVVEHSDYRADPLARLAGTIRWIFTVTYGDTVAGRRACDHVRKLHVAVTGTYIDGHGTQQAYSANDPALAEWVHLAFTDAFLRSHELFRGPVPGGADAYVREWAVAGELMGIADPPRTEAALRARLGEYDADGQLAGGPRVQEVVSFLRNPPLDPLLLPGYRLLFAAVVDTLPPRYRELLGLRRPRVRLPLVPAGRAALAVVGAALGKRSPSELAARRRLARLGAAASG